MIYDFSLIPVPGMLQCCLINAILYMTPSSKRPRFLLRLIICTVLILAAAPLLEIWFNLSMRLAQNPGGIGFNFFAFVALPTGRFFFCLSLITLAVYACCSFSLEKAFNIGICAYLAQNTAHSLFLIAKHFIFRSERLSEHTGEILLEIIVATVVYIAFYFLFVRKLVQFDQCHHNRRHNYELLAILLIAQVFTTYANYGYASVKSSFYVLLMAYDVLLSSILLGSQVLQQQVAQALKAAAVEENLRRMQSSQYDTFRENAQIIGRRSHDLKYLLTALQTSEGSDAKKSLLHELDQNLRTLAARMDTGNEALDVLLNEVWLTCTQQNIVWTCMADGSALVFVDTLDLYIMLGNILTNAVESAAKISDPQKRCVSLNIWKKDLLVFIRAENYFETLPEFKNGIPLSTKKNPSEHGFGLQSIQSVVERYGGKLQIRAENNLFHLTVVLPVPLEAK